MRPADVQLIPIYHHNGLIVILLDITHIDEKGFMYHKEVLVELLQDLFHFPIEHRKIPLPHWYQSDLTSLTHKIKKLLIR